MAISRSKVSRLLSKAREKGIVRFVVEDYDPRSKTLEAELRSRFHLNQAIVVKPLQSRSAADAGRTIGYFAGADAAQLVQPQSIVGVAGGRVLAELVRRIPPHREIPRVTVVPLMGNIGPNVTGIDAIELTRRLAQCFNAALYTINAPAFAPDLRSRDVFLAHDHVRSVWQLFHQMDLAFVGVGTLSKSAFIERGVLRAAELERLRGAGAVGEICGRFFDRQGRECDSPYRDRVISIDLDELRMKREVVAVTQGAERAPAVRAALAGRLIKSLIIDESGAQATLDLRAEP